MADKKKCPICGEEFSPRGLPNHKGSKKCYANAEGVEIGEVTVVGSGKHSDTRCLICGDIIGEEERAIMVYVGHDSYGNVKTIRYIHFDDLSEDLREDIVIEAL